MIITTKRVLLRPWEESDAQDLYQHAKDPLVGPIAGWPVHTSVENSLQIICEVLSADETYAVTLSGEGQAIGSVGLMIGEKSSLKLPESETEIGYWIGAPYWGQGLIPEAVQALMRYAFENLDMEALWCGYFDGNEQSKKAGAKCGFRFQYTEEVFWPLLDVWKTQHVTRITRAQWDEFSAGRELE